MKLSFTIFYILFSVLYVNAKYLTAELEPKLFKSYAYNYLAYDKYIKIDYGFINTFLQNEDRVRRLGPDDEGNDYQDGNEYTADPDLAVDYSRFLNFLNSNTNSFAVFEWSSDWFTEIQLGIRHHEIRRRSFLIEESSNPNTGPSFLSLNRFPGTENFSGSFSLLGPLNVDEFSTNFGIAPIRGALVGGHTYPEGATLDQAANHISVPGINHIYSLVIDRNGITIGSGFVGDIHGSMNRSTC